MFSLVWHLAFLNVCYGICNFIPETGSPDTRTPCSSLQNWKICFRCCTRGWTKVHLVESN